MSCVETRRDLGLLVVLGVMCVVAAGYPSYLSHPVTLLAPAPLLAALLVLDDGRLASVAWIASTGAMMTWAILLYLAMDGTQRGLVYSLAMYAPFAALSFRIRRPEPVVLTFAVVTSILLCGRIIASWMRSGGNWRPWQVFEGSDMASRLNVLLPLVLVAWLALPAQRRRERALLLVLVGAGVTSIVLTQQRAAVGVLAVLVVIGLARNYWKALPVLAVTLVAAWFVASQRIEDVLERMRFVNFVPSSASRPEIWRVALDAVRESSWLGVGPGRSAMALREVGGGHAHNGLIQSTLEAGWPGGLMYIALVIYVVVLAARLLWRGRDNTLWALSLLAYIGFSVFSTPLQRPDFTLVLVIVILAAREHLGSPVGPPDGSRDGSRDASLDVSGGDRCAV